MTISGFMARAVGLAAFLVLSPLAAAQDAPQVTKLTNHVYSVFWGFYNGLVGLGRVGRQFGIGQDGAKEQP